MSTTHLVTRLLAFPIFHHSPDGLTSCTIDPVQQSMVGLSHPEVVSHLKEAGSTITIKAAALDDVHAAHIPSDGPPSEVGCAVSLYVDYMRRFFYI